MDGKEKTPPIKLMESRNDIRTVVVYCSASEKVDKKYFDAAVTLGEVLSKAKINVVYGGGQLGLMGRMAKAAHEGGSEVTAIIPPIFNTDSVHVTKEVVVNSMHERKKMMADLSDGIVALPGGKNKYTHETSGIGTLEEVLEAMTWRKLNLNLHNNGKQKPIVLINIDGFYDPLIEMLDKLNKLYFLEGKQYVVVEDPKEIVKALYDHYDLELTDNEKEWKDAVLKK
eukprot:gene1716-485_t